MLLDGSIENFRSRKKSFPRISGILKNSNFSFIIWISYCILLICGHHKSASDLRSLTLFSGRYQNSISVILYCLAAAKEILQVHRAERNIWRFQCTGLKLWSYSFIVWFLLLEYLGSQNDAILHRSFGPAKILVSSWWEMISPKYFLFHQDIFDFTKIFWFHQESTHFTKWKFHQDSH